MRSRRQGSKPLTSTPTPTRRTEDDELTRWRTLASHIDAPASAVGKNHFRDPARALRLPGGRRGKPAWFVGVACGKQVTNRTAADDARFSRRAGALATGLYRRPHSSAHHIASFWRSGGVFCETQLVPRWSQGAIYGSHGPSRSQRQKSHAAKTCDAAGSRMRAGPPPKRCGFTSSSRAFSPRTPRGPCTSPKRRLRRCASESAASGKRAAAAKIAASTSAYDTMRHALAGPDMSVRVSRR
jgi:hypothetical protein